MTNKERAEEIYGNHFFRRKDRNEPIVDTIKCALDEAEKRGFLQGTQAGIVLGQKEMRERSAELIKRRFGLELAASDILALPIEGE